MNAITPTLDTTECRQFMLYWQEVTGVNHTTLVAIDPGAGGISARTFARDELDDADAWIAELQEHKHNVYFQPNETQAGCDRKPGKSNMVAVVCRFADIDPDDEHFSYQEERERLTRLSEHLVADSEYSPTAIIDSGNGMQPLWAVSRELLSDAEIARIEGETKAIENALGAGGTHNIDRLLRLPGTLNYPNAKKRRLGRGVSRARLIHCAPAIYTAAQAAMLSRHLVTRLYLTELVRSKLKNTGEKPTVERDGDEISALIGELAYLGAERISLPDQLPDGLHDRLQALMKVNQRIADRWAGLIDDLTESGCDSSRSGADMSLAAMLKVAGFTQAEAALILCAFPHGKANSGEWPDGKGRLRHVARCAVRSFDADPVSVLVAEFNERYFVVNEAGKAVIYRPLHDAVLHRGHFDRITFEDFRKLYSNRMVRVGIGADGQPITKPAPGLWLNHPKRRQFIGGVVFDPSGQRIPDNTLNLWRGLAVSPRPGSWARLRDHTLTVICRGVREHFEFLMGWMARLVQRPAERGEVALVMRGEEGTGKGTLANALLYLFGQHGLAVSNSKHLTGNFNGHLRDAVLLFADEAFFAGDKAHVGVLKSLITEPYLMVEAKYQNAVQAPNFIHLMMASNEDWVVPASLDARRFFVLEVSGDRKGDHAYFAAIQDELDTGGYEAMLHDLQSYDIKSFNHRRPPVTEGLQTQRKLTLKTADAWWTDVLYRGFVHKSRLGLEGYFGQWHENVATEILFDAYLLYAKARNDRHPMGREDFGKFMIGVGAKQCRPRNAVTGEHVTDVDNGNGGTTRKAETIVAERANGYNLGNLPAARAAFQVKTGLSTDWPDGEDGEG